MMRQAFALRFRVIFVTMITVLLVALAYPATAQDDTGEGDVIIGSASVSTIGVQISAQAAAPPIVEITGEVFDSCTEVAEITQSVEGDTITLNVSTTRPAEAFCAQVVESFEEDWAINTNGLTPGTYTLNVNGQTTEIVITDAMLSPPAEATELPERTPGECPTPDETTQLVGSVADAFCFLVPATFTAEIFLEDGMAIADGPTFENGQGVSLTVTPLRGAMTDIEMLAEQLQNTVADLEFEAIEVGNARALVTDDEPGPIGQRLAYVQQGSSIVTVRLQPIDDLFPEASAESEIVWEMFVNSFTFPNAPVPADASSATIETTCPTEEEGRSVFAGFGVCFLVPSDYMMFNNSQLLILMEPASESPVITLSLLVSEANVDTLPGLQAQLAATHEESTLNFTPLTIGGVEAIATSDIPGRLPSLQVFMLYNEMRYTFILTPVETLLTDEDSVAGDLWSLVRDSFAFNQQ